jgi:enoyl-CoA hydratase/carnithine racemase
MDTVISTVTCAYPRPGVALLTIDRPHRHNAIDPDTNDAMARWLAELDGNAQVRTSARWCPGCAPTSKRAGTTRRSAA